MANGKQSIRHRGEFCIQTPDGQPLRQLEVAEVTGHNLEARGRKEVKRLLEAGWRLLHIYTLRYEEHGVWRERPMAILGRLKQDAEATLAARSQQHRRKTEISRCFSQSSVVSHK